MRKFFSAAPLWPDAGLLIIRFIIGAFMIYHGWEVFDKEKMDGYTKWMTDLQFPAPAFMAYLGKGTELVCGVLLLIGWLTRPAAIILALTMLTVAFGMGHGKVFTDDQHPFLFVVLSLVFVFTGPGKYSADYYLYRNITSHN